MSLMKKLIYSRGYRSFNRGVVDLMFELSTRGYFGSEGYSRGEHDDETRSLLECGRAFCRILEEGRALFNSGKRDDDVADADEKTKLYAYGYMMDSIGMLERRGYDESRIFSETAEVGEAIEEMLAGNDRGNDAERYKEFFHVVGLPYHFIKRLGQPCAELPSA